MNQDSNITETKLLDSIRDGVCVLDPNHLITYVNFSALNLLGKTRADLVGKRFEDAVLLQENGEIISDKTSPLYKSQTTNSIFSNQSDPNSRLTMARADRSMLAVSMTVLPFDTISRSEGLTIIFHDLSADEKIDAAKSEFIALVSHQLRTPLNIISWYVEKMLNQKRGDLNEVQKGYLREVYSSNRRVTELVQAIVNVSRADLSRLKHKHEPIKLDEVVTRIIAEGRETAEAKNITVDINIAEADYYFNDSDQELVSVIVRNVYTNAVRYTNNDGFVRVTIDPVKSGDALAADSEMKAISDGALITVADNGIGIPDQEKKQIFTKLYRAGNVQTLDVTGVGLGLYIAQAFINELGGTIWFESQLRAGSTFYIFIPR